MMFRSIQFPFFVIMSMLSLWLSCRLAPNEDYHAIKSAASTKGMVVTAHTLASEVGLDILKQGGNAADAAIAVQFALAVVYPRAGNIGGGGFLVYRDQNGEITSLDYREKAPMGAHKDMFLDSNGAIIPNLSTEGILASGIPGTIAGLEETYKKHGTLKPWSKLVEPAIKLAEKGFRITGTEAERLNHYGDVFARFNPSDMPFLSATPWKAGDLLVQKELAQTLKLIAEKGKDGFYTGTNAEAIVSLSTKWNGIITAADLASYQAVWRKPITNHWRGYELHSMGLPSSGGIILGQILHMIEENLEDSLGHHHPQNIHLIVEAERRAYADRAHFLGDADFYPVHVDSLLNQEYLKQKFSDFNPELASSSQSIMVEKFSITKEHFETTHISIADGFGNAASVTTTLNDNFGSKVWVPGGGYFLNNEMDDFSPKPGVPNLYGLIGGEANAIAPAKRMLSSMTPTIVEKDGNLWMVLGTPGGSTIITSVLQVFLNVAAFEMDIDLAVQSKRYHHQWLPDEIMLEKNAFSTETMSFLEAKGHTLNQIEQLGLIEAILRDEKGTLHGAADHRGDDHAAGW